MRFLPGREGQAHSDPLSWDDILKEAFGGMGLHPWEFDQYTFNQYLHKRTGWIEEKRKRLEQEFENFRVVAYYAIIDKLKPQYAKKPIDQLIPNIWRPFKQESKEDIKERYKRNMEIIKQLGPPIGKGNKNNDRRGRERS
jgi:hypothetical protein